MDVGDHHGEIGEEEKLQRLLGYAQADEGLVEKAVAPEKWDPGNHADDVGGPERHRTQQKQGHLPQDATHMKGEEVRHGERSEEHTSELQSLRHLVCRLLL